jgi:hypothetical protein
MKQDIKIVNPITQITKYGSYTPKYFFVADYDYRFRMDEYKSNVTGEITNESILVVNAKDLSPVVTNRTFGTNCHCCFAGYAHSENQCSNS